MKAEHCLSIDVRPWNREGLLQPGRSGVWAWTDADTSLKVGSVAYRAVVGAVIVQFSVGGRSIRQRVDIERTACHFGGDRPWFTCPTCLRRSGLLYLRQPAGFTCRKCADVAYACQTEDGITRSWRRQQKAERRLDAGQQRPAGMHRVTHRKMLAVLRGCEARRMAGLAAALGLLRGSPVT